MNILNHRKAFTLIELLVVISIISLLASVVLAGISITRAKSRDAKRLTEIKQFQTALELYKNQYGRYPNSDGNGCGGWSVGNQSQGLLGTSGIMRPYISDLRDPTSTGNCVGYRYYRYPASWGYTGECLGKDFYVLGIVDMETSGYPHPQSPGWKCTGATPRDWQGEMEWVTGNFDN